MEIETWGRTECSLRFLIRAKKKHEKTSRLSPYLRRVNKAAAFQGEDRSDLRNARLYKVLQIPQGTVETIAVTRCIVC
jgi:hypothetical protein